MTLGEYILDLKNSVLELLKRLEALEEHVAKLEPKPKGKAEATHA